MTTPITVLFMDDEPSNDSIVNALERLREQNFEVDFVSTMSTAIEAYYQKFYDVFVLDIDMSHLPDDQEGDGVKVLKRFISLHNQTKVIMFSGAGTVQHWFAAANAHCFGYIGKDQQDGNLDSIDLLIDKIKASAVPSWIHQKNQPVTMPRQALLISDDPDLVTQAQAEVTTTLGEDWTTKAITPDELTDALVDDSRYGVVAWLQHEFSTRARVKDQLKNILGKAPYPQTIIACDGSDKSRSSILYIANQHPFRMIDLQHSQWRQSFADALKDAVNWYGKQEIFTADADTLSRIHITLPEDMQAIWHDDLSEDDLDALYDDYEAAMQDDKSSENKDAAV